LIGDLPESPYTGDVYSEGDPYPEGSFTVEYTIDKSGLDKYTITSTGVDISSGAERKIRVGNYI